MTTVEGIPRRCPSCGVRLPAGAVASCCTPCLLRLALEPEAAPPGEDSARAEDEPSPGAATFRTERFGDYELKAEIGRGGMGVVYQARQLSLDRWVALKVLDVAGVLAPDAARRFRAEASAAAALRHPGIVTIHEVGVHQGRHYLAMDLIPGPTLAEIVNRQPLAAERAARLLAAIADAIQCAHERGILHRDLKPSNILIDGSDQPHVADFGLAKRMDADASLTMPGRVMGSPSFMSPEQAMAGKLGPASDIYALGAVLYFCLAGRPPAFGQSIPDTLHHVVHGEPVLLRQLVAGVPRDLETIAFKCLEKDPAKRYPDARALADDLRRFLRREPIHARPIGRPEKVWRWCRRHPAIATLATATSLLLLTVAIGSPVATWRIRAERERAEDNLYAADMNVAQQALARSMRSQVRSLLERHRPAPGETDRRGFEWRYLWSHSASDERPLFTVAGSGRQLLSIPGTTLIAAVDGVWDTGPPARQVFALPSGLRVKAYDPANAELLAGGASGLHGWTPATGKMREIFSGEEVHVVALSPDGQWMATGGAGLTLFARDGGSSWREIARQPRRFKVWHNEQTLAFSPDGTLLVTGTGETWANRCELECWSVPALEPRPPMRDAPRDIVALAFSPAGDRLVAGCWSGDIRVWDVDTRAVVPSAMRHFGFVANVQFSPDDPNVFATAASDNTLRLWDLRAGRELVALQGPLDQIWAMNFSADGRSVLTLEQGGRLATWDVTVRRRRDQLIAGSRETTVPLGFSADGRTLVTFDQAGRLRYWDVAQAREIAAMAWTLDVSGILVHDFEILAPAISRDLASLAIGMKDGRVQLWDLRDRRERTFQGHARGLRNVAFSPDGRVLATFADDGILKLWDTASGALIAVNPLPHDPVAEDFNVPLVWSPDGRWLGLAVTNWVAVHDARDARLLHRVDAGAHVYAMRFAHDSRHLVTADDNMQVAFWESHTGRLVERLQSSHHEGIYDLCFSPDGRTMVTVVDDIKLWSAATRQEVSTLRGHERNIFATLFSPDGNVIVTADYAGAVRLWSAEPFDSIDREPQ